MNWAKNVFLKEFLYTNLNSVRTELSFEKENIVLHKAQKKYYAYLLTKKLEKHWPIVEN